MPRVGRAHLFFLSMLVPIVMSDDHTARTITRARIVIHGAVQGVGFRPFIYRLAREHELAGWVTNTPQGVILEVEGPSAIVEAFPHEIRSNKPPLARIHSLETVHMGTAGYDGFEIRPSDNEGSRSAVVMADIATCPDCLRELFDPADRRYLYPFTNCTNCGPRYSIISSLPYDRPNTSMRGFTQCPACRREYEDPADRRFHAQPNACPACGPRVQLWDRRGHILAEGKKAVEETVDHIRQGRIIALKGLGGFHLLCDATSVPAVKELRKRKRREEKPFAVLMPSLVHAHRYAGISAAEAELLSSPEAPIVLVGRTDASSLLDEAVSPDNPFLGIMLPSTPLHHILMRGLDVPVIATSGNLSDEPICFDEHEAITRLGDIADVFCVHDRPILRHVDDSIARVLLGREQILRRARGYAPLPLHTDRELPPTLAVGAHLKNTVAVASGDRIVLSQHIGDLETTESLDVFQRVVRDLPHLHDIHPAHIACDLHPDYLSTQYAHTLGVPLLGVQHHLAHVYACMAEQELHPPVLGVSWDGTGLGTDGTAWGGEFLVVDREGWKRFAALRPFRLPGGDAAAKEPRRSALSVLFELMGDDLSARTDLPAVAAFETSALKPLLRMIGTGIRSPYTTSAGRLFDAVASIIGRRQVVRHEGQAAMQLEWLARTSDDDGSYALPLVEGDGVRFLDWREMIEAILTDLRMKLPINVIARRFHNSLVEGIILAARAADIPDVALTGGCFQNGLLTELAVRGLRRAGFVPWWHQRIPPNDGGIAAGQAYAMAMTSAASHAARLAEAHP